MIVNLPAEVLEKKIFLIRGQKVMIDADLAELYGIETKVLIQKVKRNIKRFPDDFMFQLTKEEFESLRSHFVTSKETRGGRRYMPYAFTKQGVAMLSTVLKSDKAIAVTIRIMRLLKKHREMQSEKELLRKIETLEKQCDEQRKIMTDLFRAILTYRLIQRGR